jgi:nucleolar protein 56
MLRNYDQVRVNNKNLIDIFQRENFDVKLMSDSSQNEINLNKLDLIIKFGLSDNKDELAATLQKFAITLSSLKVKETSEKLDLHLVQAVNTLDELDEIVNTISTGFVSGMDSISQNWTIYFKISLHIPIS